jgi:hypothetical protein
MVNNLPNTGDREIPLAAYTVVALEQMARPVPAEEKPLGRQG